MTAHNALGQPVEAYGWPNSLRESVRREQEQPVRDFEHEKRVAQESADRLLEEHRVGYRKQDLHPVRPGEVIDALDGGLVE